MGVLLSNLVAIYRKELQSYFAAPFSYIIAGIFWLISGVLFLVVLQGIVDLTYIYDQSGRMIDVPYEVLKGFLGWLTGLSLFLAPILSMNLYAEERRRGTLELLATAPITNWVVALGKLMGVMTFFTTLILPLMVYEAIAFNAASPPLPMRIILLAHIGLLLLGAVVLSLGMFISSLTESAILAAILTFILIIVLFLLNLFIDNLTGPLGEVIGHFSLLNHYGNFIQGIADSSSLVVFLSYIFLGLFLTAQSVELLRFQQS